MTGTRPHIPAVYTSPPIQRHGICLFTHDLFDAVVHGGCISTADLVFCRV
uniref:Uncharacterized protein n=1 Tax=Anguilla anguilla TaxID=7936 RepID=A0A0E9TDX4_ANGAN